MAEIKYVKGFAFGIIYENGTHNVYYEYDEEPIFTGSYDDCLEFLEGWEDSLY